MWTHKRCGLAKQVEVMIWKILSLGDHPKLMMGEDLMDDRWCRGTKDFTGAWIHFGTHDVSDGKAVLKDLKGEINGWDQSLWVFSVC